MWEAKWLSVGAPENIKVCRRYLGQMAKKTKTKSQNRTGWLVNGTSLVQIAIFGIHLSQMDVWNKARKLELFHLTDDIVNGLKDKLSKTEDSYGCLSCQECLQKALDELQKLSHCSSIHPSIHSSVMGFPGERTHAAHPLSPCLSSWLAASSQGQTPSLLDQSHSRPEGSNYVFYFPLEGYKKRKANQWGAQRCVCVLHVAQAAKMGKIHGASHLILLHHLPTWQSVFLVLVVYLVEPRQSPALREEHMQSGRREHLTNQGHKLVAPPQCG